MSVEAVEAVFTGTDTIVSAAGLPMEDSERILSILFAGVSGSARLHEKLGGAEALRAVDRCLKRVERAVEAAGGRVVKTGADEMMAVFESAEDACQAAIEMQERVMDLPSVSGIKLAIRVGFANGAAHGDDDDLGGETVDEAARLAGLAKPGQVLTSIVTHGLLPASARRSAREVRLGGGQNPPTVAFEIAIHEAGTAAKLAGGAVAGTEAKAAHLTLRYEDAVIVVDEQNQLLNLGRDAKGNTVLVRDRRASRHHARIEWRGDRVVLVDCSTNGTYVTLTGKPELFLRRGECILRGKGLICFAASASSPDADFAEFDAD